MLAVVGRTAIVVVAFVGFIFAIAGIILNGCASNRVYVRVSPPASRHEVIPSSPHAAAVWVSGYWVWTGREYGWMEGRWEIEPRGDAWVPGHWNRTSRGWIYVAGHWSK